MTVGALRGYRRIATTCLALAVVLAALVSFHQSAQAAPGINEQMNFQGRLLNAQGATVADGYYNIEFKIYRDGDGQTAGNTTGSPAGTLLWTESHLNANSEGVMVKNGFLSVQLGAVNPFGNNVDWNQDTLWLSMNVGNTNATCTPFSSCAPDGEMVPMKRLSSTPFSLNSKRLGGMSAAQFVQLAQGVQLDASLNTASIHINKTGTGNLIELQSGGAAALLVDQAGDISFGAAADHNISIAQAGSGQAGNNLTISAGSAGSASSLDGGDLILQGGAGDGLGNTGSVVVRSVSSSDSIFRVEDQLGGTLLNVDGASKVVSVGQGVNQTVPILSMPIMSDTGGTMPSGTTYYYGVSAINGTVETEISPIITASISSLTSTNSVTLNWSSSFGATGYKIYRNTTNNFTTGSLLLATVAAGTTNYTDTGIATAAGLPPTTYAASLLKLDSAAKDPSSSGQIDLLGSMYYNTTLGEFQCYTDAGVGGAWGDCGVTTLQGAYENVPDDEAMADRPTIELNATQGGFSVQDNDVTIGEDLFTVRSSNPAGLGSIMFGIGSSGDVSIQNTTDQESTFRILNQSGEYLVNVNSSSDYFITNTTRAVANSLQNAGFEAGGDLNGGAQGWQGTSRGIILNDAAQARHGNHSLRISPNGSMLKVYAGSFYEVQLDDVVHFEGWVKNSSGSNGGAGVIVEGYDKDKNLISSSTSSTTLPGTSYVARSSNYTVPNNVSYVRVAALVSNAATSGDFYFDDFYLNSSQRGQQVFQNTVDSTAAFMIQSAGAAQTLLTANTSGNLLKVGDSTGSGADTTLLVLDNATANPTANLAGMNGGLFYRSDTNTLKAVVNGTVVDVCTSAFICSGYSAGASSSVQLQGSTPGTAQVGNFNISGTGILTRLQTMNQTAASTDSQDLTITTGNAFGTGSSSGDLILDVGSAVTPGRVLIAGSGASTVMGGTLSIQGSNSLTLGTSGVANGAILFRSAYGSNTISLKMPGVQPVTTFSLTLPEQLGSAGDCLKDSGNGVLVFNDCSAGSTTTLQSVYDNSNPAEINLADSKDFTITARQANNAPNMIVDLQCSSSCGAGEGRFSVQNNGLDVFTVHPNSLGITLSLDTQIGSAAPDGTQVNLQLDSANIAKTSEQVCTPSQNQGAMYYNSLMGTIRACMNGAWSDISNPDTLGLLSFGIVPSSGSDPYDLPSLTIDGVSGPCKVSRSSATTVDIQPCVAYSSGRRVTIPATTLSINSASGANTLLTGTNRWAHICINATTSQAEFFTDNGVASASQGLPSFIITAPVVCLASVQATTAGTAIDNLYDTRTFTSTFKEPVATSVASELGMLVDTGTGGTVLPADSGSARLYGVVVATNGQTSTGQPNAIVTTMGSAWVKATAGTAGQFIRTSTTDGYGDTTISIPNNSFYYSVGYARTDYETACTTANDCSGSLYVNFNVR